MPPLPRSRSSLLLLWGGGRSLELPLRSRRPGDWEGGSDLGVAGSLCPGMICSKGL